MASGRNLFIVVILLCLGVVGLEMVLNRAADGTFLIALTLFTGIVQGAIGVVAATEIAGGKWVNPIKKELLSLYPLLLFAALLFLLMGAKMGIYAWTAHPTVWLDVRFFLIRNFVLLMITFWIARQLTMSILSDGPRRRNYAVLYVVFFCFSQSMIAFDWIMPLEYPWISTLFGWYIWIQSFLMGLMVGAFVVFFKARGGQKGLTPVSWDIGKLMFAFCFLWGGFFFTQYLVIWYGNIPEEVGFVLKRVGPGPFWGLSRVVLALIFIVPFVTLVFRKVKQAPIGLITVSLIAFAGLFLEKLVLVTPVVPINPVALGGELALLIAAVVVVIKSCNSFMPQAVTAAELSGEASSGH